ncbi:MAG: hypothetical protein JO058_14895 [Alphaproteobacteria bacterium]|nr:hypothetical protein [Alphaproteobacteria bacterium]MBV9150727.1 hypothetical protein [Alphaproteobacteria bacterium]
MGAWGVGLYSGDFAQDLKSTISAVCRLPLPEERLVDAICDTESSAAADPANEDHTIFWLVLADQFEKRRIFCERVRRTALSIIDGGKDAATMEALGMTPADTRKRAAKLVELRARLLAQPEASPERKTIKSPEPYVFDLYGVYAYPICGGEPINPYMTAKHFDRAAWHPDGIGLMMVVSRARAFGYLAWYVAVKATESMPAVLDRAVVAATVRWAAPFYGTCNPMHFRKLELSEVGVFNLDPARVDHFFPHLAAGNVYAVKDISIANRMKIGRIEPRHWWRRPDGKTEPIVYPPAPTLTELALAKPGIQD